MNSFKSDSEFHLLSDVDTPIINLIRETGLREQMLKKRHTDKTIIHEIWKKSTLHNQMLQLTKSHTRPKIVQDPIYGAIILQPMEMDLISTWEMQRLRYIRQLGPTHLVFPSATHTRFEHSLGTNFLAQKSLRVIPFSDDINSQHFSPLSELFDEYHQQLFRITALLHDVGHSPTSHTIEQAIETWCGFNHLAFGEFLIRKSQIADVLSFHGFQPNDVVDILCGSATTFKQLITEFIDSPLDIDKIDYLIRDAYFTGSQLGVFPAERVLLTSRVVKYANHYRRVFLLKALSSIESLVLSRNWMFNDIYLHHAVRIAESMLNEAAFLRLRELSLSKNECIGFFTRMTDADFYHWLADSENATVKEYTTRIRYRRLFKGVINRRLSSFSSEVQAKFARMRDDMSLLLEAEAELCDDPSRVIIDVILPKLGEAEMREIAVLCPLTSGGHELRPLKELDEASPLLHALDQQKIMIPSIRVYSDKKFAELVQRKFEREFPVSKIN